MSPYEAVSKHHSRNISIDSTTWFISTNWSSNHLLMLMQDIELYFSQQLCSTIKLMRESSHSHILISLQPRKWISMYNTRNNKQEQQLQTWSIKRIRQIGEIIIGYIPFSISPSVFASAYTSWSSCNLLIAASKSLPDSSKAFSIS